MGTQNLSTENPDTGNPDTGNLTREGAGSAGAAPANRSIVERALTELVRTGDVDALAALLHDDFVHHRPGLTSSTKEEWLAAVRAVPMTDLRVEIHHLLAEGDHVVTHSRRRLPDAGPGIAGVDIWRLDNGLIVEGWEVIEPVNRAAENMRWWSSTER
ncbi:nuclear transport factor 2 family protein [Streptomyces profundus]|uniref:nuclear transport factor 2 family protein n=1 Tax=Streptomyces profundus TaxID=2867410 RepID=UPI001D15EAC5|nr:nuclear transport factor 2 family protein [Streptomyces sp. MA3_2.13]UED85526.1 nuclear transport factor 2 family protein [Streptomyces sp. MA3_2.13]